MKLNAASVFAAVSTFIVVACVIAGFYLVGPPSLVRAHRLDQERIQALGFVVHAVEAFHERQGVLPDSLNAAYRQSDAAPSQARDPGTGVPYEYRRSDAASYELCARFDAPSEPDAPLRWRHGPGRACFAFQVKPSEAPKPATQSVGPS